MPPLHHVAHCGKHRHCTCHSRKSWSCRSCRQPCLAKASSKLKCQVLFLCHVEEDLCIWYTGFSVFCVRHWDLECSALAPTSGLTQIHIAATLALAWLPLAILRLLDHARAGLCQALCHTYNALAKSWLAVAQTHQIAGAVPHHEDSSLALTTGKELPHACHS